LDNSLKSQACLKISSELKNNKKDKLSDLILNTAIENALLIDNVLVKIRALTSISNYLISIGKKGDAIELSNSALRTIEETSNIRQKCICLSKLSTNYEKLGWRKKSNQLVQQALEYADRESNSSGFNPRMKVSNLKFIALELAIQGKNKKLNSVIQDAIDSALTIVADVPRNSAISELAIGLLELGYFKKAKTLADKNTNLWDKGRALDRISLKLVIQGKIEEALVITQEIKNDFMRTASFLNIALEMIKIGKYNEANHIALQLEVNKLFKLCEEFYKKKRFSEVYSLLYKMIAQETTNDISSRVKIISNLSKEKSLEQNYTDAIIITRSIDSNHNGTKSRLLASISTAMFEQGQTKTSLLIIEEALQCALEDDHHIFMYENLKYILNELIKQGNIEYALEMLNHIQIKRDKIIVLSSLSTSLFLRGNTQLANQFLLEAKQSILSDYEYYLKESNSLISVCHSSLFQLSLDLFKQGLHDESASMIRLINDKVKKCEAIAAISAFSRFQGNKEIPVLKSTELLEIYNCLGNEINDSERDTVRCILTKELIYEGQDQKAKIFINEIKNDKIKHSALSALSEYLFINHRYQEAEQILMQLKNNIEKQKALHSIVKYVFDKSGLKEVYRCLTFFKIEELKFLWLIEIHKNIPLKEYNKDVIISILKTQAIDLKTLSVFLQKFALFELFYNKRTKNLSRYNHQFNIQWAIDIKNQLPN
jgi:tetratricopeptide (TPR) repeat protein